MSYANSLPQLALPRLLQHALGLSASVRSLCVLRLPHRNQSYEGYQGHVEEECLKVNVYS
jgi:hypothetical protein